MTTDDDLRLMEERVRGHFGRRAAAITPDTLGPARPPRPEPARRWFAWPRTAGARTVAPFAAGLLTVGAVAGWVFLAPDHDGSTTVPPGRSVTVPAPDPLRPSTDPGPSEPAPSTSTTTPEPVASDPTPPATAPVSPPEASSSRTGTRQSAVPPAPSRTAEPSRGGTASAIQTGTPPGEPRPTAAVPAAATPSSVR